ncbi:flagellar motor switch protein FliN [candidate division KSB1 bacterium]|nr:MAG: flagellar motor switch protein FliN [candidate division KSB1 bacterium 4484_219]RKY75335.1 MAG: flagellar motor switch protein FliN [candidate division KSB1 bacterium]RKY77680.1 MAG: flagellar motor switch protein FliN [candidate division KSB1 bacterium]RKY92727.1 MAG: flagellar motor switch protein FliN [candidate division KSB1 bacterium]
MNEPVDKNTTPEQNSTPTEETTVVNEESQKEEQRIEEPKEVVENLGAQVQSQEPEVIPNEVKVETMKSTFSFLFDLELPVSVELARKEMLVRDILQLGENSIIEFDKPAGEVVDLLVNNKKIAEGEVVVIEDRFGIRITNLVDPGERIRNLSK